MADAIPTKHIYIRVPVDDFCALSHRAAKRRMDLSEFIRALIKDETQSALRDWNEHRRRGSTATKI